MSVNRIDMKRFGAQLMEKRMGKGWARKRLADRSGLTDTTIRKMEQGEFGSIGIDVLSSLSRALAVPLVELLEDMGLDPMGGTFPEVSKLTRGLSNPELSALAENARTLREVRASYESLQREPTQARDHLGAAEPTPELTPEPTPSPPDDELDWDITTEPVAAASGRNVDQILRAERDIQERHEEEPDVDL